MKRLFALFIASVMSISCGITTLADDKGLADAITAAKKYITVPDDQKNIDYDIYNNEVGNAIISISWSSEEKTTSVSLDKDGCLLTYDNYNGNAPEQKKLAALSGETTKAAADKFLSVVYGENASYFKFEDTDLSRYSHQYRYKIYINNRPVSNGNATISIDPNTGEVMEFSGVGKEFFNIKYPAASGIIASDEALKILYDGSVKPFYNIYTNYNYRAKDNKRERKAFLVYSADSTYTAVNAFTGEKTNVDRYFNRYAAKAEMNEETAADSAAGTDGGFTEEELAAIDSAEGLVSKDRAEQIAKEAFPLLKNISFTTSTIAKNNYEDVYYIRLNCNEAYVSMNAKTGEIKSYRYYKSGYDEKVVPVQESVAKTTASRLIKKLAPADSKKVAEAEVSTYGGNTDITYSRIENSYKCNNEYLEVSLDKNGDITGYTNNFDHKLSFPKPANVMSEDKAIKVLTDTFDFDLIYSVDESYKVSLLYCYNDNGMVDASTGIKLDYTGEPVKEEAESGIEDVKGHWCEKYVTALYNNGYRINDTSFRPDRAITLGELKEFFSDYSYEPYYIENDEESKEAEDNKTVTRYELADYILDYYNLEKIKDMGDIFVVTDYKDEISEEHKPAVAIATKLNILHGDEKDCFNGNNEVTRAEAAAALYNILTSES